ncbi:hypothetical protein D3C81_1661250 [compost metagenome]
MLQHQPMPAAQDGAARLRRLLAPCRPGRFGRTDGAPRFGRAHLRHAAQQFAGSRIRDADGGAVVGIAPAAVDICLLAQQGGVVQL